MRINITRPNNKQAGGFFFVSVAILQTDILFVPQLLQQDTCHKIP
jgi:hypothetical protein